MWELQHPGPHAPDLSTQAEEEVVEYSIWCPKRAEVKLVGNSINMPETVGMARSTSTGMHVAAVGAPILQAGAEQKDQAEKANKSEPLLTQGHGVT